MAPTEGTVRVDGRVSALLALGVGFQGDLTGRDNIYLNGVYLGLSPDEIHGKEEGIIAFAEIEEAIDFPVRTYSSGMRARLAFAIAQAVKPDILILDELMAVGDLNFQQKSAERMRELISESRAMVVVSHSMNTIRELCQRVVWLEKGRLVAEGAVEEVVGQYERAAQG
jgi:ABC-type polysaccharide/polyol phosphate transport system ATPase subunit